MHRVITLILVCANSCLLVVYLGGWTNSQTQDNKKTIIRRLTLVKEPVEIAIELDGAPVKSSKAVIAEQGIRTEEFEADSDWLKNIKLRLTNNSGKTITHMVLNLSFPETREPDGRIGMHQVILGVDPERKFPGPEISLAPGESMEVGLGTRHKDIKALVESKIRIEKITKVEVEFHSALFDDGTLFSAGELYRRNPDKTDARKWIRIDR
jgi:hypothetical protein